MFTDTLAVSSYTVIAFAASMGNIKYHPSFRQLEPFFYEYLRDILQVVDTDANVGLRLGT